MAGAGMLALWLAGCGIGTDPSVRDRSDGDLGGGSDATVLLSWPNGLPPIDQVTWEDSATATFALG